MDYRIHFKITHGGVTRRFALCRDEEDLLSALRRRVYRITEADELSLYWKDEDSLCVLDSDDDMHAAIDFAQTQNKLACVSLVTGADRGENERQAVVSMEESDAAFNGVPFACDGCDCFLAPSNGGKYRCMICDDFDLCAACFAKRNHPNHAFVHLTNANTEIPQIMDGRVGSTALKYAYRCAPKFFTNPDERLRQPETSDYQETRAVNVENQTERRSRSAERRQEEFNREVEENAAREERERAEAEDRELLNAFYSRRNRCEERDSDERRADHYLEAAVQRSDLAADRERGGRNARNNNQQPEFDSDFWYQQRRDGNNRNNRRDRVDSNRDRGVERGRDEYDRERRGREALDRVTRECEQRRDEAEEPSARREYYSSRYGSADGVREQGGWQADRRGRGQGERENDRNERNERRRDGFGNERRGQAVFDTFWNHRRDPTRGARERSGRDAVFPSRDLERQPDRYVEATEDIENAYLKASQMPAHMAIAVLRNLNGLFKERIDVKLTEFIGHLINNTYGVKVRRHIFSDKADQDYLFGNIAVDLQKHLRDIQLVLRSRANHKDDCVRLCNERIAKLNSALKQNGADGDGYVTTAKDLYPILLTAMYTPRGQVRGNWEDCWVGFMEEDARRGASRLPRVASACPSDEGLFAREGRGTITTFPRG